MDILEQIKAGYGSFSRPRQRISDFILNNPEQCCFLSLKNFAEQVGTTEVTVLNFCRGLGLNSYMALKKALQDYLIMRVNSGERLKMAVSGSGSAQELYQRVCAQLGNAAPLTLEKPVLAAEDFSFYQQYVPGVFFFLGTGDTPQLHAPDFAFDDEAVLPRGVEFLKKLLLLP